MSEKRINEGYIITDSVHIGSSEFVIGKNSAVPPMYVTWECANGDYYFWGHYMTDRMDAEADLLQRAKERLDRERYYQEMRQMGKEKQQECR